MGPQLKKKSFLHARWHSSRRPAGPPSPDRRDPWPRIGLLLCLLWPSLAPAYELHADYASILSGLTAGVAMACGLACAVAWAYTRDSTYAAALAFVLVEGLFRSMPTLMPPGALQAGSYAALLALTAPLLRNSSHAARLAAACRRISIALAGVAALALIFVQETMNGMLPAAVAGVCAVISIPLAACFAARAAKGETARAVSLALALAYALSAWLLWQDAWRPNGADTAGAAFPLMRLMLVAAALLWLALDTPARARSTPRHIAHADAEHIAQGELRLSQLAGALDTQHQMNALISHELRAPLATISAAAQSLDMILADSGEAVDNRLARIHRSVARMTELMDQLLNQERLGEQAWTPRGEHTDLAGLARDVVAAMQPDTAHALVLQAQVPLPVFCDHPLTSVVVRNLIHNAIKYSPASEPVRIETGNTQVGDAPMAWVAVIDRGPGIGEDEQSRIFEPHFRRSAHRETKGMGIGLYLARRICENQGGSLTMQSRVGVGTRFVVTLPTTDPSADSRPDGQPDEVQAANT